MTHEDIQQSDIVDRYVRRDLAKSEAGAFEEHFFGCDECFAQVEHTSRFAQAVRLAAPADWLENESPASWHSRWAWAPMAASVMLAIVAAWSWFVTIPDLRMQLASSTAVARTAPQTRPASAATVVPNVPLAILSAERDTSAPRTLAVPAGAAELVLWIEAPESPAPGGARLEVLAGNGGRVTVVPQLVRNANGAYVVAIPPSVMPPGLYRLRLSTMPSAGSVLLGEYLLTIASAG